MNVTKQHIKQYATLHKLWLIIIVGLCLVILLGFIIYSLAVQRLTTTACSVHGVTAHRDMVYAASPSVDTRATSLDLYLPQRRGDCPTRLPLVVWVHGGSFTGGDKASGIEYKKQLFTSQGWAFASVGYRLTSPERPVAHPAQVRDIAAALGWLYKNQQQYQIDVENTMLVGYSAGAYLVSLISTDSQYAASEKFPSRSISCTVALDTGAYDLPHYLQSDDGAVGAYRDILGSDERAWQRHSPLHLAASASYLPDFLLVTRRGEGIRPILTQSFADALVKKHVQATVWHADQYMHSELDSRLGAPGDSLLTSEVMHFLRTCINR